jgi:glycerophosphoryl diester phosphodiesterase
MAHPYFDVPKPIVIGHRGCAGEAPENTLAAFEAGLRAGASILESDVHLSRDGVPVLIHDDRVDRVTEATGVVADLTVAALQRLDAGYRFSPDAGNTFPFRGCGLRIPTFEEALRAHPGARFNIEIKSDDPESVTATVDVVVRQRREALTLLTAAEEPLMRRLRQHLDRRNLRLAQGASTADVLAVIRSCTDGTPPDTPSLALQIPSEFGGRPLVTRELVKHAHLHGIQIHVWTVNEANEMDALLDLGVDGLVTDYPGRLVALIAERRARSER